MEILDTNSYILIFGSIIIVSYFFNSVAKKSGIPAVLMLIGLGLSINFFVPFSESLTDALKLLGTVGLILIVLEAALDLRLLKEKVGVIISSLLSSIFGLVVTGVIAAVFILMVIPEFSQETVNGTTSELPFSKAMAHALMLTIPLSILSSAIILPSIEDLDEKKKEFMIYESTFSDIIGIVAFYAVLAYVGSDDPDGVIPGTFLKLFEIIVFSFIISYVLIYIFQLLKGHAKLFLLISVLLVLYSAGKMAHYSALLIILIFGLILNNYDLFFKGFLKRLVEKEKVEKILSDFRLVTVESAFVVRTFFFVLFGWSIVLSKLVDFKVVGIGIVLIFIIYVVRFIGLLIFNKTTKLEVVTPEVFVAPRGLITILLFYKIPDNIKGDNPLLDGILLFVILFSCLIMSWSLISNKTSKTDEAGLINNFDGEGVDSDQTNNDPAQPNSIVDFEESEKTENNS